MTYRAHLYTAASGVISGLCTQNTSLAKAPWTLVWASCPSIHLGVHRIVLGQLTRLSAAAVFGSLSESYICLGQN